MVSLGYVQIRPEMTYSGSGPLLIIMLWEKIGLFEEFSPFLFLNINNDSGILWLTSHYTSGSSKSQKNGT